MSRDLERQLTRLQQGDHVCLIYEDPAERMAAVVPFMKDGLARGERCLCVMDAESIPLVADALRAAGVDVDQETGRGALGLLTEYDTYLRLGRFDPVAIVDFWREATEQAQADGFSSFRLAGEVTRAMQEAPGADRLIEYEGMLQRVLPRLGITSLCIYERRRFEPSIIRVVLQTHGIAVLGGDVCSNLYCEPPGFDPGRSTDGARVTWMIQELRFAQKKDGAHRLLAGAGASLGASLDWDATLLSAARLAVPVLADWCLEDVIEQHGAVGRLEVAYADRIPEQLARSLLDLQPIEGCPVCARVRQVARTGESVLLSEVEGIWTGARSHATDHRELLRQLGTGSLMIVPLRTRNRVVGVMTLGSSRTSGASWRYGADDLDLAEDLAHRAALAIENARLHRELGEREQLLHDLVGRLLVAEDEERRRVAHDLHDGLAQVAASASRHIEAFGDYYRPRSRRARQELDRALALAKQTVSEARQVIAGLRPTALDDFGLAAAVRLEVEALSAEGWGVEYKELLGAERLPRATETALFRVCQEALTNVRKHTRPCPIRVTLSRRRDVVRLVIRDSGGGFDMMACARRGGPSDHVGLASMRERVGMLGGRLTVRSRPGEGTVIRAVVPLRAAELDGIRDEATAETR